MRKGKKTLAFIIAICMAFTAAVPLQAQALEAGEKIQDGQPQAGEEARQNGQELPGKGIVQFLMQESESIQVPGTQNVAAALGEEGAVLESASLQYVKTDSGEGFTVEAQGISGNMARFSMEYGSQGQAGVYKLASIRYQAGGESYEANLEEQGMEVSYGVDCQAGTEPDEVLLNQELLEEVEANVVTMDENGSVASSQSIGDILGQEAEGQGSPLLRSDPKGAKDMVVILDPGHDSTHAGAGYFGYKEQDLVLKIALYCREELQKYTGISIYMTRETGACPYGGKGVDSATCNARRVEFAQSKGADAYVSFHLNASPSAGAQGVGVYYPNSNYKKPIGEEGKGLATAIYQKLSELGLATWADGILIRNSENNTTYPDGSLADYLAVIRRSKLAGFPAVLIEHAFLSNESDVANFLNSDAKLKKLGVKDAEAVAGYYKLSLRGTAPKVLWVQSRGSQKLRVKWEAIADGVSYQVYRSSAKDGEYSKIATVTGDMYDDKKLDPQGTYYYKVRAVLADGEVSKFSNVYEAKPIPQPQVASVVSKSGGKLLVSWNGAEGAVKYELFRSEDENGEYKKVTTLNAQAGNSYLDGQIETGKPYYYKVRARGGDQNGFGDYSVPLSGWAIEPAQITRVSSKTSTSMLLKWKQVPNTYAYRIQRSAYKNKGYATIATIRSAGTVSYVDKKLKKGVKYYYRIQCINRVNGKNGVSSYSSPVAENTVTPTSIVHVRSKNSKSMEIKWAKDPSAYLYRIKRSTKEKGTYEKVADVKGSSKDTYVDSAIVSGKNYYYVVETIVKKNGVNNYSGNSKPVSGRNLASVKVESMQSQNSGIQLTWKAVAGANGYQIVRSAAKKGPYKQVAKLKGKSSVTFTDPNVEVGNQYFYKIRALRTGTVKGYGSYTSAQEMWMVDSPKGIKVSSQKANKVKLSWKKKTGADGYQILRSTKEGTGYRVVGSVSGASKTSYTDVAVVPNKTYYYKVSATGSWGLEGIGNEPAPVTASTAVPKSGIKSITAGDGGSLVLHLAGVSGAYGYEVRRSKQPDKGFQVVGEASQGTVYTDVGLEEGTAYYYKVRTVWVASGKKYYSGYSDVKSKGVSQN